MKQLRRGFEMRAVGAITVRMIAIYAFTCRDQH
jgi:hypothetical protein